MVNKEWLFWRTRACALLVASALVSGAQASGLPSAVADESYPIVELMPIVMKHEAELALSPEQSAALVEFRRAAMPKRLALQSEIKQVRAELRQRILDGAAPAQQQALLERWLRAEREHAEMRARCAEFLRTTLTPQQMALVQQRYVESLR
ncbi:Spy/CpxP family protein refolding chaperone [Tepidimonas taiwanensis]|jgi:hypothetical protein|uniref:Heavy-metal resistance n=1 Tax=Tepidimonas taiwanensis TaxID=307486 RepID=A0A554XB09_9BURK|nr:Spy/CpxP family protein refolding chaperone [Tepidimonas taiwanensis]MCX7693197.1 Spy/CpxP family protein refolding chaperone [Tepidimonas taiwanensis]TSE32959.1 hypothetical protein Ttaiw_00819 [Tepidimonas taiwanensis]UBQ04507.1 Spy/CpxP family protein refolding chaperone [Tepidimonas taiwanensis]